MVSRKQLLVVAVVAMIVLLAPLAVLGILFFPPDFMYSHYSSYSYTTSISTNSTIDNATVLLPFPAGEDVTDPIENIWIYDGEGNQLTDWETAVVETAHGPMLRLDIGELVGDDRYVLWTYAPNGSVLDRQEIGPDQIPSNMTNKELVPDPTTYSISWQVTVDHDIETRYPIGNASFIQPLTTMTRVECQDPWDDEESCANFTTMASATYESDGPATVTLDSIRFEAWNEWGFWLSNSFNTFEATTTAAVYTDGRQGWTVVDGELRAGMGRYDGPER